MRYLLVLLSSFAFAQQNQLVDFKKINADISINPVKRNVVGKYQAVFEVKNAIDTIKIDAQKMEFSNVKINGKKVNFKENKKQLLLFEGFSNGENKITFDYEAFPTQTMYFVNWDFTKENSSPEKVQGQIWTQGQGKYTSHWLPSFDDVNEKVIFGLNIRFQKSFAVVSNGELKKKKSKRDDFIWQYQMDEPMSSYLMMLAIGHFEKETTKSSSGIPLEMYYEKEDANRVEPTYRYSREMFDFFEKEIGVKYPWKIYRQIPVRDFLYAGMENTSATIFSRDFVVDSTGFFDRSYVDVNAHELAHQWFGDLITAQSGKDHWLQEGFATYYALLAQKEIFGEDYFYDKMNLSMENIIDAQATDTIPVLNEKASTMTYYKKGAWALHVLHEALGREKFNEAVKNYLNKYAFKNVTTDDFLAEIKAVSNYDTAAFKTKWLEDSKFPQHEAIELLKKNDFMKRYYDIHANPISDESEQLKIMNSKVYFPIKELILEQSFEQPFEKKEKLLTAALNTNDLHVRQVVVGIMPAIPQGFREKFETLLNDKSYETQEMALYKLWRQFPDERQRYIEISKNWVGFQNKNLRLMHLYLAYMTYQDKEDKDRVYRELLSYTGTNYDSTLQQMALEKLLGLKIINEDVMKSLAYGTANPRWQFVKFSKDTIRKLLKAPMNRAIYTNMLGELPIREKTQLQRLLDEK